MALDRTSAGKLATRASATLTALAAVGLVAAGGLAPMASATATLKLLGPAMGPAPAEAAPMGGVRQSKARAATVLGTGYAEPAGRVHLAAARRRPDRGESSYPVPDTAWDGTPLGGKPPAAADTRDNGTNGAAPATQPVPEQVKSPAKDKATVKAKSGEDGTSAERTKQNGAPQPTKEAAKPPAEPPTTAAPVSTSKPADAAPLPPPPEEWTAEEIATALKECVKLLGPIDAEIEPADAMRKGPCGSPAPVLLKSVGRERRVEFSPPVEVNCQLAVALARWADGPLQQAARQAFSKTVTRITGASGYSCRNRYGLANAPLSEHALANAVDIPAFVLQDGTSVRVKSGWGPTARDLAKPKTDTAAAAGKPGAAASKTDPIPVESSRPCVKSGTSTTKIEKAAARKDKKGKTAKSDKPAETKAALPAECLDEAKAAGAAEPAKAKRKVASLDDVPMQGLGAAGQARSVPAAEGAPAAKPTAEGRFLREVFKGGCATFGTVLGPEANDAHRDHFHFDMKARKRAAYCQ